MTDRTTAGHPAEGSTSRSTSIGDPGGEFLQRVRRAATQVLGDSPAGREVLELCDEHAETHDCGGEYFLPVVKSPRVGVCGYTGDAW